MATTPRDAEGDLDGDDEELAGDSDYDLVDAEWELRAHEELRRFRDHDPDDRGLRRPKRRRRRRDI